MDGEQDGAQARGEEQQGQQGDPQTDDKQQEPKAPEQVGAPDDEEIRVALAERDEKIAVDRDNVYILPDDEDGM